MKKLTALLVLLLVLSMALLGCAKSECTHSYYLSNYTSPSSNTNGYNEYTCRNCGSSYREVIPATGSTSQESPAAVPEETKAQGFSKNDRTINLFNLPIYSEGQSFIGNIVYEEDVLDTKGYRHKNVFILYTSEDDYHYVRYDLDGKYTTLAGTIYAQSAGAGTWLEFYDGDDFLFSTARLDDGENASVTFSFDITGVKFLTVYPKNSGAYNRSHIIIADEITISE